jgi:hypothetical protein
MTAYVGVRGCGVFEVLRHEADNKYVVCGPENVAEEKERKQSELMKQTSRCCNL